MLPRSEVFRLENRIAGCKCTLRGKCAVKQKFREVAGTHWAAPGMTSSSSGHYLMSKPGGGNMECFLAERKITGLNLCSFHVFF